MSKIYTMDDFKRQERKLKREDWFRSKRREFEIWFNNNRELALIVLPVAGTATVALAKGAVSLGKGAVRARNLKKEKEVKDLYCYDRSLGHYWALKRELSNKEWIEIDKRKKNGERLADILDELKVLK